jgi:tellurite resistance protein
MAVRYIRSPATSAEITGVPREHRDEEVMQALVTAGALVALSDGRVEAAERDELVNFADAIGHENPAGPAIANKQPPQRYGV